MKNFILSGFSVILTLLGTYYFQLYTVLYFDSGLFRWSLGLVVSTFLVCLVVMSIFKDRRTYEPAILSPLIEELRTKELIVIDGEKEYVIKDIGFAEFIKEEIRAGRIKQKK